MYMDNAPVHNPAMLKRIGERAGHTVVFAPKYSPEMNPIENVFGTWKKRADSVILSKELTEDNIIQAIADTFYSLSGENLRAAVSHVFLTVYRKVFNNEDI